MAKAKSKKSTKKSVTRKPATKKRAGKKETGGAKTSAAKLVQHIETLTATTTATGNACKLLAGQIAQLAVEVREVLGKKPVEQKLPHQTQVVEADGTLPKTDNAAQLSMFDLTTAPIPQNGETKFTKDEVGQILQEVGGKTGIDVIGDLIKKHGGTRMSDLPEANYGKIVAEARAL